MSVIDYSWDFSKEDFSLDLDFFNEKEQEDKLWQARTGLDIETLCGAIETIIFMNDKPINLQKIKNQIDPDLPLRVVHESIARLQAEYEAKHHGIRLMEVAQGYQFRTKATYSKIIQKMFKVQTLQLSPTALEVLAIIAYKQPISKTSVESIRGVDSSHVVRALMDRRLVKIVGRSDEMGRPSLFGTTSEFLEVFNLNTVDELPSEIELEEIANANEVGQISDIKNIIASTDTKHFDIDELEELDALSSSIKDIASDTLFTKSLKDMDKVRVTEEGVQKKSAFDILEEYVSKAQIIEQNKQSMESEILSSVMEPKAIELLQIMDKIFNAPEIDEDDTELEIEVELEGGEAADLELTADLASDTEFEELDSSNVKEIEAQAQEVLEKSEQLINEVIASESAGKTDVTLEDEIDLAFDQLFSGSDSEVEQEIELVEASETPVDLDELDLSSFISAKLDMAQSDSETTSSDTASADDEAELAAALDQAFAKLNLDEASEQEADKLDIDVDFLKNSMSADVGEDGTSQDFDS